jgi:myo-inositol-1-phosphate synthase
MIESPADIKPAEGKLGVLLPGIGAVSTTFVAGVAAIRRGLALPIGSLTQLGNIRVGLRNEVRFPKIKEFVPLAGLGDLVFGGWTSSRMIATRQRPRQVSSSRTCSTA